MGFFASLFKGTIRRVAQQAAQAAVDELTERARNEIADNSSLEDEEREWMTDGVVLIENRADEVVGEFIDKHVG